MKIIVTIETRGAQLCINATNEGSPTGPLEAGIALHMIEEIHDVIALSAKAIELMGVGKVAMITEGPVASACTAAWNAGKSMPAQPTQPDAN